MTIQLFLHKVRKALGNPSLILIRGLRKTSLLWPSKWYLQLTYYLTNGQWLNLNHPLTFNEKLNWLKLHDHNPLYNTLADKYKVKKFVADKIGEEYVVPCIGLWSRFEDIDFDSLPSQFVLKATHNSGGIVICRSREQFNKRETHKRLQKAMSENWYKTSHEWVYKDLEPHIIADTFLDDHRQGELQDYKFWCFDGEPKVMYFTNKTENEDEIYENFFDMDFRPLPIDHGFPRFVPEYQRPANFEKMKDLARQLANGIPFVRIDFFDIEGHIYFGEFTFYDWGGMKAFGKEQDDRMLGSWITLPQISKS